MAKAVRTMKKWAMMPVRAVVNRIDFVRIMDYVSNLEPGRSFQRRTLKTPPAFLDQEDIIRLTIELTQADLTAKGDGFTIREIEDSARRICCQYETYIHETAAGAFYNIVTHLFEHQDQEAIFLSEDRRETKHLGQLLEARKNGLGVVYLVNHSSHLDEFIVDVALEQMGIQIPLFAAGDNMMATPSIKRILMMGSYVIIRRGATKVYLATLFHFCRAMGELGKQQGIFLEAWAGGARTRDGSLRYPRRLVTLQGALAAKNDVVVQPVGLSYSLVPEDLGLSERAGALSWLNGHRIYRHLLTSPLHPLQAMARGIHHLYGRAYLTLGRPRMVSELEDMRRSDKAGLALDEFASLYAMNEIARGKKIMASHLAARALVRVRRDGGSDLVEAAKLELDGIVDYHRRTFGEDPDLEDFIRDHTLQDVIDDGLGTLRRRGIVDQGLGVRHVNGLEYYATHADHRLYSPSAKENIVIVGAGALGYALGRLIGERTLEDKRYSLSSLILFDSREDLIQGLIEHRGHPVHFPKLRLPKNVFPASDAKAAFRKANDVVITSSVDHFETDFRTVLSEGPQVSRVVIASRGFEPVSHLLPVQIAQKVLRETGRTEVALMVLSGPVPAERLAEMSGGALVLAGPRDTTQALTSLFTLPGFSVYVSDDPVGVQAAATLAEVYSLLGSYLTRTKEMNGRLDTAAFFRETSDEALRLILALGGRKETFMADNPAWVAEYVAAGLGGPGAVFGRQAGRSRGWLSTSAREYAQNASLEHHENGYLIGYMGIRSAYTKAKELNLELPRLRQAYRLFWKDLD